MSPEEASQRMYNRSDLEEGTQKGWKGVLDVNTVKTAFAVMFLSGASHVAIASPIAIDSSLGILGRVSLLGIPPFVSDFDFESQGSTTDPLHVSVFAEESNTTQLVRLSAGVDATWDSPASGRVQYDYIGRFEQITQGGFLEADRDAGVWRYRFISDVTGKLLIDWFVVSGGFSGGFTLFFNEGPIADWSGPFVSSAGNSGSATFDISAGRSYTFEARPQFGLYRANPIPQTADFVASDSFIWRIEAVPEPATGLLSLSGFIMAIAWHTQRRKACARQNHTNR